MTRESCIQHPSSQTLAIIRNDYKDLTGDFVSAALLNAFEYKASCCIECNPKLIDLTEVPLGEMSISELEKKLLGLSTDKQIRLRLAYLADQGLIKTTKIAGKQAIYKFCKAKTQSALNYLGQTTEVKQPRSNDRGTSVKQPTEPRSNDQITIYKNYLKQKKEEAEQLFSSQGKEDMGGESIQGKIGFEQSVAQPHSEQPTAEPKINPSALTTVQRSVDLEEKASSGATPKSFPKKLTPDHFEWFRQIYNQHKPEWWATCQSCNADRLRLISRLVKDYGDRSLDVFEQAVMYAARDDYWSKWGKGCIETIFYKSRYTQWSEAWQADAERFSNGAPSTKEERRMQEIFEAINGVGT